MQQQRKAQHRSVGSLAQGSMDSILPWLVLCYQWKLVQNTSSSTTQTAGQHLCDHQREAQRLQISRWTALIENASSRKIPIINQMQTVTTKCSAARTRSTSITLSYYYGTTVLHRVVTAGSACLLSTANWPMAKINDTKNGRKIPNPPCNENPNGTTPEKFLVACRGNPTKQRSSKDATRSIVQIVYLTGTGFGLPAVGVYSLGCSIALAVDVWSALKGEPLFTFYDRLLEEISPRFFLLKKKVQSIAWGGCAEYFGVPPKTRACTCYVMITKKAYPSAPICEMLNSINLGHRVQ